MGWLIAGILLVILLRTRRQLKTLTEPARLTLSPEAGPNPELIHVSPHRQVCDLSVLRLELGRLRESATITDAHYMELNDHIDAVLSKVVHRSWADPQSRTWSKSRDAAWALLLLHHTTLPGRPPWHRGTEQMRDTAEELVSQPVAVPALPAAAETAILSAPSITPPAAEPGTPEPPLHHNVVPEEEPAPHYALDPTPPSAMERALQAVSGWPALLVPFMAQNIGWFIGGFCFVAGSVFLVSYTTGFAKSLTIFSVLFAYTLLVLWAGYQLCRRRPELTTSGRVLLTIGVLLAPLNIAAAVRLMVTGLPAAGPVALGLLAAALCLGGLYYAIVLVSGIVDRALQGRHPQLFLALAAMQLTLPLLTLWPSWPVLALLHTALLALLITGIVRFMKDWLHAIFIERRNTAYYTAGTMVYAATVSFVHLTWGYQGTLPDGYYGPFLMLLCGVLFYADAQLKQWINRDAFLSRLSFAIYGLSILALFAAVGSPVPHVLTLVLALIIYAAVMWQYVTLPPLYLLLGCSAWLYHTIVLSQVPFDGYFLASVPGLAGLLLWSWQALRFQSPVLAQMSFRVWLISGLGLAAWSLGHAQPGLIAVATPLLTMAMAFLAPRYLPAPLLDSLRFRRGASIEPNHGHQSAWHYAGMLSAVITIAYTPPWLGLSWATQLAIGLLLLAQLWTLIGWHQQRGAQPDTPSGTNVWFNGAVLTTAMFLLIASALWSDGITANRALPLLLTLGGGILLQISWLLGIQWLLYGVLLLWGAAGVIVKWTYFPDSGSGITALSAALAAWATLWRIEHIPTEVIARLRQQAEVRMQNAPPWVLLWRWPVAYRPLADIVGQPLQHAMLLLGAVGLLQAGRHLLTGEPKWSGAIAAGMGAVLTLLITGHFRWTWLCPLAIVLGLCSWLAGAYLLGVTAIAGLSLLGTVYAIGIWQGGLRLLAHPRVVHYCRLFKLRGGRRMLEPVIYRAAFAITFFSLLIPFGQLGLFAPHLPLLGSLATAMVFLWLSGQHDGRRIDYYLLLGLGTFSAVLGYIWTFYADIASTQLINRWTILLADPGLGATILLAALTLWSIAWAITHRLSSQAVQDTSSAMAQHVYLTPLRTMAVGLALAASSQQLVLAVMASFGTHDTNQILSIGVLGLSGITLLLANHGLGKPVISFAGMMAGVLALLWAQGLGVHGSPVCSAGLWQSHCADQWFTLAFIASGLAILAHYISRNPRWERLYIQPLYLASVTTYSWALLGAITLFAMALRWAAAPWLLLALSLALIPVAYRLPKAAEVRGVGIGLLLIGSAASALASGSWHAASWWFCSGLAFAFWGLGNLVLPRYNVRWPHWRIAPGTWPWFGLCILGIAFAWWWEYGPVSQWHVSLQLGAYLTACALYLFLMLRNSRWPGMPWLAVLALLGSGAAYNIALVQSFTSTISPIVLCFGLGNLAWLNLLLWGASCWRRYGSAVATRLAWHDHDLDRPLLVWTLVGLLIGVLGLTALETLAILWAKLATDIVPWASIAMAGVALTFTCFHRLGLKRNALSGHTAAASGFCTLLAFWLGLAVWADLTTWGFHLPLFLALWSALLVIVDIECKTPTPRLEAIRQPLSQWLVCSPPAAIVALAFFPHVSLGELLLILGIFGGVSAYLGWQRQQAAWLFMAMSALVVQLHALWCFWIPLQQIAWLLPVYATQLAGLMWLAGWLRHRTVRPEVRQALYGQQLLLAALALGTWVWHGFQGFTHLMGLASAPGQPGLGEITMGIAAPLLLIVFGIKQAKRTQQAAWVYGVAGLSGMLGLYIRLLGFGLAPVQVWDTIALIGAAYALFALQRLTQSRPILHIVMVLPMLALGTIPFQLTSPHASGALLTIGMLYLVTRRATDHVLPLYLGMTALNAGLYLWVPSWAHHYHLGQLYMIPAALSVLWLLHVHRHDVRPNVLHSVRLATLCVLYISATADVFLRSSMLVFIAALSLSLGGIIVGIALRTRAFLYAGVAFFVLNVGGQLFLLFPEQRLGKAVILLTLGAGITGIMIWFNMQRESILQRIRVFRSDLAEWQ